jgi:hypothetical protein
MVVVVSSKGLGQFLEEATLVVGQFRRNFYPNNYDLITATLLPQIGNPLPTQAEGLAVLGARWQAQLFCPFERWHTDFSTQRGLSNIDGQIENNVVAIALEKGMRLNIKGNVKVPRWPTTRPGLTFTTNPNLL